ncbi:hypothetical protein EUBSIR_00622 [[Eubacterium] siraeum DSM 15702]|uniref:Uncharacterized protein n=1 Tax=[Eubacterium] siraeum DSM 15702 TaxID=428128 RepID=B0MLD3_9FIRM|nr:hypothetical protein EUBSIR_00622 [[Eubacterium] siraeum DSM 15702]
MFALSITQIAVVCNIYFSIKFKYLFIKPSNPTKVIKTEKKKAAKRIALPQFV